MIGEWNFPCVSLGIRILILISIGEKIILDSHWFMKNEGAIGHVSKFKEGSWKGTKGEKEYLVFWGKAKEKNGNVRKKLILKYGMVLFMKKMCVNKSMEGSCV